MEYRTQESFHIFLYQNVARRELYPLSKIALVLGIVVRVKLGRDCPPKGDFSWISPIVASLAYRAQQIFWNIF